ncbi:MAG TPA: hypothetical protein PKO15_07535 [Fibrobacteria bacterium]|nr:hypothetical protein [Fibrobacteria bacterium]
MQETSVNGLSRGSIHALVAVADTKVAMHARIQDGQSSGSFVARAYLGGD